MWLNSQSLKNLEMDIFVDQMWILPMVPVLFSGALAQLVERLHGMQEVSGSTPLCSTSLRYRVGFFYAATNSSGGDSILAMA